MGLTFLSKLAVVMVIGTNLIGFYPSNTAGEEVRWVEEMTWSQVTTMAIWYQKPILIDFYADWCVPCKRLDEEVYTDPEVATALHEFITFKVDVGKPAYHELRETFLVFSLPTVLLCHPDGEEIDRLVGYRPAGEFLAAVRAGLAGRNTLSDIRQQLRADPFDPELVLLAGTKHARLQNKHQARLYFQRAQELDPDNRLGVAAKALWRLANMERRLGNVDAAITTYQHILYEFPEYGMAERVLSLLTHVQRQMGDEMGMVSTYRELVRRNPADVKTLKRFAWNAAEVGVALEEATNIALKAVALSDEDPGVMDTLAMVYHTRGMHTEAITWIKRAIAKEPDDLYYQHQLAKYEKAALGGPS
jgi:thioredoxin-like negative regulator of GroEL